MRSAEKSKVDKDAIIKRLKIDLALAESTTNIHRTEHWEAYTEALALLDKAEGELRDYKHKAAVFDADRTYVLKRKRELTKIDKARESLAELERLRTRVDELEKELAARPKRRVRAPEEALAQFDAERAQWVEKKRKYVKELDEVNLTKAWIYAKAGSDVY